MIRIPSRRGYTLIELMVVISVSSTLMVLAIGWIHQSMKLGSVMRDRQHHHQSLLRLSRQLRDDVHQGESLAVEKETRLVITMAGQQTTVYEIMPERLSRVTRDANAVTSRESFPIDPRAIAHWEPAELPDWISLLVERGSHAATIRKETSSDASEPRPIDLHIRAAVGRRARQTIESEETP